MNQAHSELARIVATALDMIDDNGDFDDARDNDTTYPVELHRQAVFAMRDLRDALSNDLGKRYAERVTADRELTPEDQDMIRELLDAGPRGHEIHKLLVLSARHLPPDVVPDIGMSLAADGVVSYTLLDIGWLVWVPNDPAGYVESEEFAPPEELLAVQKFARDLGCDYILFDREGPVDGSLPAWGEDD